MSWKYEDGYYVRTDEVKSCDNLESFKPDIVGMKYSKKHAYTDYIYDYRKKELSRAATGNLSRAGIFSANPLRLVKGVLETQRHEPDYECDNNFIQKDGYLFDIIFHGFVLGHCGVYCKDCNHGKLYCVYPITVVMNVHDTFNRVMLLAFAKECDRIDRLRLDMKDGSFIQGSRHSFLNIFAGVEPSRFDPTTNI